jgi:WD40 repeat protein
MMHEKKGFRLQWLIPVLFMLILAGCQAAELPSELVSPPATPAPQPTATLPSYESNREPGWLAYIGADGNVYVTTSNRSVTIPVTTNATKDAENGRLVYQRIAWSPDGQLAVAALEQSDNKLHSAVLVVATPGDVPRLVGQSDGHFVIYMYWSPQPCDISPKCRRLAYLVGHDQGVAMRLVEIDGISSKQLTEDGQLRFASTQAEPPTQKGVNNTQIGVGRPFYFGWSPDGRKLLWHVGGAKRINPGAFLGIYDLSAGKLEMLPAKPGLFLAPAWSPQGDQWLAVTAEDKIDQLQSFGQEERFTVASGEDSQFVFEWSPTGDKIAYAMRDGSIPFYDAIHVYDLKTGESRRITERSFRIRGFYWSPDGERIAYLIHMQLPRAEWMQWRTYDLERGLDRGFTAFHPSSEMRFMVDNFNQYAQSHRFWSADGRYLVYADEDPRFVERIWLVDTWAEKGSEPFFVAEGGVAVWSWH